MGLSPPWDFGMSGTFPNRDLSELWGQSHKGTAPGGMFYTSKLRDSLSELSRSSI